MTSKPSNTNLKRAAARLAAVQALFQMEAAGSGIEAVIAEFRAHRLAGDCDGQVLHPAEADFFEDIVRGVVTGQQRLDTYLERHLKTGWRLSRIDATARAILRAALFELTNRIDVPFKVVIDEYLDIAHAFFDGDEAAFINGVLDQAARDARSDEVVAS